LGYERVGREIWKKGDKGMKEIKERGKRNNDWLET
jgi:hypothetical protein